MANTLKIKRGTAATIPQGQLAEPLFTTDTYDLYIGKGSGGNQRIQNYIASGTSSQFLKGDGSLDSTTYQATSEKGQNNGYASLDAGGKIPAAQLPSSVIEYKGTWNASTNTPTLADGTGDAGDVYIVSVGGTQNLGSGSITFDAGDWVMYNGSVWQKSTGSNAVASVNGQTGIVSIGVNDLDDATITSVSNGQLLQYNSTSGKWVNWTPTYISAAITSLNGLTGATQTFANDTNVTITSASSTHTIGWSGQLAISRGGTGLSALGTAGQLLRVNSGATALEYFTPTYISAAITSLNGLTAAIQTFAVGTSGTDFAISSSTSTHTFNLPTASATNRGALSSADWSTFNNKQNAFGNQNQGTFFAGPSTPTPATPTFRALVASDIPSLSYLPLSGGTLTGTLTINNSNNTSGIVISGSSLTVGNDQSLINLSQTWNTSGYPTAIKLNITNTSSGILSNLVDLQVGGTSEFKVDKDGNTTIAGTLNGTSASMSSTSTATAFIPTGSAIPTNGMYLSAANTLNFATNSGSRLSISSTGAATFSSSVMVNGSTVSTEGLSVQYNQAKTYTTSTAVSRWHSNEASGSQFKLNLFAIGNASGSSRVFALQTSNEGVANDGVIALQHLGGNVGIGTTSPTYRLDVSTPENVRFKGTSNYMTLLLDNSLAAGGGGMYFQQNGTVGGGIGSSGWWLGNTTNDLLLVAASGKNIRFHTDDSANERMRITSGGRVGIGTDSPNAGLEVVTDSSVINAVRVVSNLAFSTAPDVAIGFRYRHDSTNYTTGGLIVVAKDNTTSGNQSGNMQFYTNNAGTVGERMRITSGGELLINTTTDSGDYKLQVNGNIYNKVTQGAIQFWSNSNNPSINIRANTNYNAILAFTQEGVSDRWSIGTKSADSNLYFSTGDALGSVQVTFSSSGNVTATAYFESSDIRLKDVLTNSYSENFSAIEFMWKDKRDDKKHWGYAAQDVMKYIPDAIEVNNDGMMTVNYNEAHTWKIAQLEKEILELKAKING